MVDHLADRVDQLDHELGHVIAGRRLAAEDEGARDDGVVGVLLDALVEADDVQQVQMLALVLVHALGLDVEQALRVHRDPGVLFQPDGQVAFGRGLDLAPARL